jgi:N-acetylmuramoyl-L-alanine amidase
VGGGERAYFLVEELLKDHLIIHCAATPASANVDSRDIDRWHRSQGWLGCGYNEVITRSGERQNFKGGYPTRRLDEVPAHVGDCGRGWNQRSIGVCLVGGVNAKGMPENNFTDKQWRSLEDAVAEYAGEKFEKIASKNIMGHRDLIKITGAPYKACPSFSVQEWLTGVKLEDRDDQRLDPSSTLARNKDAPDQPGLPTPQLAQAYHLIKKGDTLGSISNLHGVPLRTLVSLNKLKNPNLIVVGQLLKLHPSAGA